MQPWTWNHKIGPLSHVALGEGNQVSEVHAKEVIPLACRLSKAVSRSILWVDSREGLEEVARGLSRASRVAVDLEADSLYRYKERICLLQLCSDQTVVLVDALALEDLGPLRSILEDPHTEKIFHGADYDLRLLKAEAGIQPRGIFDTMVAAQCLGADRLGLSDLLETRLGVRLRKGFQRADWGKRPLPESMVLYAVEDTCYLLALREALARELEAAGRMDWAAAKFMALEAIEPLRRQPPSALRIPGARDLDDRGRAVLQCLLEWREKEAQRRDVPVFKVMGNETLLLLARQRPMDPSSLAGTSGITSNMMRSWGPGLLEAIREGMARKPMAWPEPRRSKPNPPGSKRRFLALKEIRDRKAAQESVAPGVLCPNSSLRALARAEAHELEERLRELLKPWQHQLLGEAFRQILERPAAKPSPRR